MSKEPRIVTSTPHRHVWDSPHFSEPHATVDDLLLGPRYPRQDPLNVRALRKETLTSPPVYVKLLKFSVIEANL